MTARTVRQGVSGEFVAGAALAGSRAPAASDADVVDAIYETVGQARPSTVASPAFVPIALAKGLSLLGKQAETPASASSIFWAAGLALALVAFWGAGGHALMSGFGGDWFSNADARLRVAHFASRVEESGGRPMLMVDGELANDGRTTVAVPPYSIDITTADGVTTRHFVEQRGRSIEPAGRYRFSSRLVAPPRAVVSVKITLEPDPAMKQGGA